ncbi:MAG: hypothetical protein QOD98_4459, partial [Nocardioidaceae bacterium]|nr:hypothetical protein [Nocardioidaceae bacterium]
MSRLPRLLRLSVPLLLLGGAAYIGVGGASASDDPQVTAAGAALQDYIAAIGDVATLPSLAQQLPLTTLQPAGAAGLALSSTLAAVSSGLAGSYADTDALVAALEARDGTTGGVAYALGCAATPCGSATPVTGVKTGSSLALVVPVHLSRTVSAPLAFNSGPVKVRDGSIEAALTFDTTLHLTVNLATVVASPTTSIGLAPVTATVAATVTNANAAVTVDLGLTTLDVALAVPSASLALPIAITDPDGVGGLTRDELTNTALADRASSTVTKALNATATFDSPLLPATPDATATLSIVGGNVNASFASGAFDALGDFSKISADDLLGGVGQLGAGLSSLSAGADVALPFLHEGLATLAKLAQPVLDFVSSQSVVCGTTDSSPPSGPVDGTTAGLLFFCSATALGAVRPGSIAWTVKGATAFTDADHANGDDTISPTSTANALRKRAQFKTTGTEPLVVTATYELDDTDHTKQSVSQPPTTAASLMARLHGIAGFDLPSDALSYDPATKALDFHLVRTFNIPAGSLPNGTIDIGDKLKALTGISALGARTASGASSATLKVGLKNVTLDIHFGVLLVADVADIDLAQDSTEAVEDEGEHRGRVVRVEVEAGQRRLEAVGLHVEVGAGQRLRCVADLDRDGAFAEDRRGCGTGVDRRLPGEGGVELGVDDRGHHGTRAVVEHVEGPEPAKGRGVRNGEAAGQRDRAGREVHGEQRRGRVLAGEAERSVDVDAQEAEGATQGHRAGHGRVLDRQHVAARRPAD